MTRDEIAKMAIEAGLEGFRYTSMIPEAEWQMLERFAKLIRNDYSNKHAQLWLKRIDEAIQAEREACAKVCDDIDTEYNGEDVLATWCAQAIRARGEQ